MNFLQQAMRLVTRRPSFRAIGATLFLALCALFPTLAMAAEGDNVHLKFSQSDKYVLIASLVLGILAVIYAFTLRAKLLKHSPGSENMQRVGKAIKDGALAYLQQQVRMMLIFVVVLSVGLFLLYNSVSIAVCFILGVASSYLAGYAGMLTAVDGNMRTANAALTSYKKTLEIAFKSGAVAGMVTVGLGLIGASVILLVAGENATTLLIGFGFGGSLAALFMRVGGGIFTKAADVGADLVGKVEAGIPEDDPRNPATIADNVGDNVGDCAGMAADVFESYEVTLVAAIVLGAATASIFDQQTWTRLVVFALAARGIGIIASVIGIESVRGDDDVNVDPLKNIRKGFYLSAVIAAVATAVLAFVFMGGNGKSPIVTSQFKALQTITEEQRKEAQAFKSKIKVDRPSITDDEITTEFQKSKYATENSLSDSTAKQAVDTFMASDEEDLRAATISKEYKPVDINSNDEVLKYTTTSGKLYRDPAKPADPELMSLKEAFQPGRLRLFQVEVTPAKAADPKAPPPVTQKPWLGPTTLESIQEFISKNGFGVGSNAKLLTPDGLLVTLYEKSADKIAIGVKGFTGNIAELQRIQLPVAKEDVATVTKLIKSPPADGKPGIKPVPVLVGETNANAVPWYSFAIAIVFGIFLAFVIEYLTDYYVSTHKKPTQEVAGVASAGPAPMIIQGFAYACESSVFMVFAIVFALCVPLFLFNPTTYGLILSFYGIALVGLGLLTTTGYVLAMDTFGPISDNAQGVFEMSGDGHGNEYGSKAVQRLDAAGNTTKALTKGFAIATAVVAAVALFHSYLESAKLEAIGLRLDIPEIFLGLLIGAAAPYLFSAFAINAVGRAAFELINEVRRQFRTDPGIMKGTSLPDYGRCVAIVTKAAQKELLGPAILAIALPMAVAFGFSIGKPQTVIGGHSYNLVGAQALGGFLAGAIASGQLLAVLLANSGGMWDNAKKLIEDGLHGGKGTEAHKAGIVCDTVGDPFKDTAGPALNPLIKVMNLVALLLAVKVIQPYPDNVLITITVVCVAALIGSIYMSKKGSLSSEMQKATGDGGAAAMAAAAATSYSATGHEPVLTEAPVPKQTLTVESLTQEPTDPEA